MNQEFEFENRTVSMYLHRWFETPITDTANVYNVCHSPGMATDQRGSAAQPAFHHAESCPDAGGACCPSGNGKTCDKLDPLASGTESGEDPAVSAAGGEGFPVVCHAGSPGQSPGCGV